MGYLVLQEFSHQFAGLDDENITASPGRDIPLSI
jgi:hypothetical protein